jgi:MFS superfamily sulfate permease-like transporter
VQPDGETTFSEIAHVLDAISVGPLLIALVALAILIAWETPWFKRHRVFTLIQGPLVAVVAGNVLNLAFRGHQALALSTDQLVGVPVAEGLTGLASFLKAPDLAGLSQPAVYKTAFVMAVVASLETLLCVEATDKLDPHKHVTPTNRELKAQGIGNIVSGLLGGLPITQVIVRSSTNIQSGGVSKLSTITHGVLLLISVLLIPQVMNMIPLATLAAVLLVVGYKLAKRALRAGAAGHLPEQGQRAAGPERRTRRHARGDQRRGVRLRARRRRGDHRRLRTEREGQKHRGGGEGTRRPSPHDEALDRQARRRADGR